MENSKLRRSSKMFFFCLSCCSACIGSQPVTRSQLVTLCHVYMTISDGCQTSSRHCHQSDKLGYPVRILIGRNREHLAEPLRQKLSLRCSHSSNPPPMSSAVKSQRLYLLTWKKSFYFIFILLSWKGVHTAYSYEPVCVSDKLGYIVGFWLLEMTISSNQKPTIYRNLDEDTEVGAIILLFSLVQILWLLRKPTSLWLVALLLPINWDKA